MSSNILLLLLIFLLIYLLYDKKKRNRTFISMTSDESHLPFIHKTLDSLLHGEIQPHKIILNLPNHKHNIPINLTNQKYKDKLIIQKCNNYGPGNNLLPTILNKKKLGILNNDNILVTSDKIDYPNNFLKGMISKCKYNKAIVNKTICKDCPSVLFKIGSIQNIDTSIPQEEVVVKKTSSDPIPSEENINITAEQDYNINIPREIKEDVNLEMDNINGNDMPYDNIKQGDLYNNHKIEPEYEVITEEPQEIPQFNDDHKLPPIPKITIDRNKKLIQPNKVYIKEKCNPAIETCSYTKNQFHNKFTRIDFIPDAKKFTIVKKHLDMNNIESFTI